MSLSKDARVSKDGHKRDHAPRPSFETAARRARPPQDEVRGFDFDRLMRLVFMKPILRLGTPMSKLRLTFACGPYDRTQALRDGSLQPEGIDLNYLALQPAEIFWRMLQYREFDASEMSLSNYTSLVSEGNAPFIAIPAFPSRVFRHGYFFINADMGIRHPGDLKGKRGGVPEYSMTAAVYMRGLLEHEYGVKPSDVEWVQGRADRLGRKLPPDIRLTQAPAGTELGDMPGAGRDRFPDDRQQSAVVPPRQCEGAAAVPRLCGGREGLLPAHQDLSDHAHGSDPPRRL